MPVDAVPGGIRRLAQSLNTMLERLQSRTLRLQEFSSDTAHELRTPINNPYPDPGVAGAGGT